MTEIFSVKVLGSTDLDIKSPMYNVIVRISIVNATTGELLEKSDPEQKCVSFNEKTEYISPVATKGVKLDNLSELSPHWDEKFFFNEPISTILSDEVLLFFEIFDTYVHPSRHNFTPISWSFLRLKSPEECRNLNHPCQLQLHYYPSLSFDVSLKGIKLPVQSLLANRKKCNGRLNVEVRKERMQEVCEVTGRPRIFCENEIGREELEKLINRKDEDEEDETGKKTEKTRKRPKPRILRPANRRCTIPKYLKAQIPAGEKGALALAFNRNGDVLAVAIQEGQNYVIQLYSTISFERFKTFAAHVDLIYEITFSYDDRLMMTVSADGMAKAWLNENDYALRSTLAHPGYIYTGKFHPKDDRVVVTGGIDGIIRVWDRPQREVLIEWDDVHNVQINSLCFSSDGNRLYSGDADGVIGVFNTNLEPDGVDGFEKVMRIEKSEIENIPITHVEMGKSKFFLLVHTQDSVVRIFDSKVMIPLKRFNGIICKRFKMMSTFSPDGKFVLAGSENGGVMLWKVQEAETVSVTEWICKFETPVTTVAWNRVENMIAFSSFGENMPVLVFYDPETPAPPQDDFDLL